MLNIVIPMAGRGSRFASAGFADPKPLIPLHGVPMIQVVIANLTPTVPHRFIFICQREHYVAYGLDRLLPLWTNDPKVVLLDGVTQGAACTVLAAQQFIDNDDPLMIANSDQYVATSIDAYLYDLTNRQLDGLIMTMTADDPKWSFASTTAEGLVTKVVEKEVISKDATVGIYNFAHGRAFVAAAQEMIDDDETVNGEFYVAPVYNRMIADGHRVGIFGIGSDGEGMHGLGTPADLAAFLALPQSLAAAQGC
ncbi:glycosyltransferase family 2 protein [Massilia sp. PWRC2]|uniref:glycosyltransferase family 2 protein n=1 Tax=Massilia sp. PWRC2 TaxID=2804626 RepID=UPI003CE7F632